MILQNGSYIEDQLRKKHLSEMETIALTIKNEEEEYSNTCKKP